MSLQTTLRSSAALVVCAAVGLAQAPANDDCTGALAVTVGQTPFNSLTATDGTGLPLIPAVCDMGLFGDEQLYQDVWFSLTPATTGLYDIASVANGGPSFDSRLAVYDQSGCPDDPMNVIACDDDSGPGVEAAVSGVSLTAGSTYIIRIGSYNPFTLEQPADLDIFTPPPPPANDDCANAIAVGTGLTSFDTSSATDGAGLELVSAVCDPGPSGDDQIYQDAWFTFTPTTTDFYDLAVVNNGNTSFDSRIAVYDQSTCPDDPLNVIACDDDDGPGLEALVTGVSMTMGTTYLIRVGSFSATTTEQPAALSIAVGPPPPTPPANDDCVNATPITAFGTYAWDNTLATTDGPDLAGICDYGLGDDVSKKDVWFEYTPTVGGCTYISTLGLAGFDNRISVYATSSCPVDPLTVVACSDEEVQPIATPFEAGMDVTLSAGTTYLIQIGNFSTSTTVGGPGSLFIGAGPVAVNNDGGMQSGAPGCGAAPTFPSSCNGDGGDQLGCTDCPCGNNAPMGTVGGCLNSSGNASRIDASGDASVSLPSGSTTDLRFTMTGGPSASTAVLLSGAAVAPTNAANPCFGLNSGAQSIDRDGLRCAVQSLLRHGNRQTNVSGDIMDSAGPSRVWGGEAQPTNGISGQGAFVSGQSRFFQVTHRDDPAAVCMRGLNTSQAVQVTFTP